MSITQQTMLNQQNQGFGNYGNRLTNKTGTYNNGLAFSSVQNNNQGYAANWDNQAADFGGTSNYGTQTGDGLFGIDNQQWGNIGQAGQLGLGLANAYSGYKNMQLKRDAFDFNKDMKQKEYAMAKDAYDRQIRRATSIGDQMRAGQVEG